MCTYGFTDFSNGSSAFGSNSSHPTPLQSTTSGFSNNAGPSTEPTVGSITPASSFSATLHWAVVVVQQLILGMLSGFVWTTTEQKPTFGGRFGYTTPSQPSLFGGSTSQQTQPAFRINALGSSAVFGAPNQPSYRIMDSFSAPAAFGAATTSPFAAPTSPFGSQPTSTFGSRGGFGTSAFGLTVGTPRTLSGQPSSFGTSSAFGQTNSRFGGSPFNSTPFSFAPQTSPFGTPTTTPSPFSFPAGAFGQPARGSKVVAYAPTAETECTNFSGGKQTFENGKHVSISAMPVYKEKSHEELRWEDYKLGCKGNPHFGSTPFATSNKAVSPSGFQSSEFPRSGGTQNSVFGPPSHPVLTSGPHRFGKARFVRETSMGDNNDSSTGNNNTGIDSNPHLHPSSPYYVHPADNPTTILYQPVLTSENYATWVRGFRKALSAKAKLGYIDGTIVKPEISADIPY
ncbi:nuclear pore complex protein NUP98A-like [Papaver somniferum]|uniref:nuclear pore complex protein NUP98A-like n=1 Tax=Papaver somniferum TaxID=3469 RepID=UPI000E7044B9|nr:nuclear pore complex protein NUP98A-like [Papaver somniferum]